MGSPSFALPSLSKLVDDGDFFIQSVYTKPPNVAGRGYKIHKTPVHQFAEERGLTVFTPATLKDQSIENVDIVVLVAYGLYIPKCILNIPKYGCINVHPSLLPRWRGASPIESAILAGDEVTGVSIMRMNEHFDEGDVFAFETVPIANRDVVEMTSLLSELGSDLLLKVLKEIESLSPKPQPNIGVTFAPKIESALIDWNDNAAFIERQIRAFGGKNFYFDSKLLKIVSAEYYVEDHSFNNGEVINASLHIACSKSILIPLTVQPAGKKVMNIKDFINGLKKS